MGARAYCVSTLQSGVPSVHDMLDDKPDALHVQEFRKIWKCLFISFVNTSGEFPRLTGKKFERQVKLMRHK
jgi:hypothetical protein